MISYEEIKNWLQEKENKQKIIYGFCFVLVFVIGFGTGRFDRDYQKTRTQPQSYYTTKSAAGKAAAGGGGEAAKVLGTTTDPQSPCPVKGNPGSKIYHLPGGAFYDTLKSPQCFQSEAQAQAAGYRKSGR